MEPGAIQDRLFAAIPDKKRAGNFAFAWLSGPLRLLLYFNLVGPHGLEPWTKGF